MAGDVSAYCTIQMHTTGDSLTLLTGTSEKMEDGEAQALVTSCQQLLKYLYAVVHGCCLPVRV